uniref:Uncharacterized protein n=1 Tax=Wuchereria bancrofti TaxID=6293 RepID=A0AAF5PUL5_WUCBA
MDQFFLALVTSLKQFSSSQILPTLTSKIALEIQRTDVDMHHKLDFKLCGTSRDIKTKVFSVNLRDLKIKRNVVYLYSLRKHLNLISL